jgi:hypothetical protein
MNSRSSTLLGAASSAFSRRALIAWNSAQRVDCDDVATVAPGFGQRRKHPRHVGAGVEAHCENKIGLVQIIEAHAALVDTERLVESGAAARFMGQVAAFRQVFVLWTREKLQHERRCVAEPAGGVEQRFVG